MTTTTTNEINNKTTTILTDDEIRVWLQEAIQAELQGCGFTWLQWAVSEAADAMDYLESYDRDSLEDALLALERAEVAVASGRWQQAREQLQEARAALGFMLDTGAVDRAVAQPIEEQLEWCDSALFDAGLERGSMDWETWIPEPSCLDFEPYYSDLWRVLEAWEEEGAKLALDGDQLVIAEEEEGETVFPEED